MLAGYCDLDIAHLESLLVQNPGLMIGEVGLDRRYAHFVSLEAQKKFLLGAIELAFRYSRPLVLHCVGCDGALIDLLGQKAPKAMWHRCQVSEQSALVLMKLGIYMSFRALTRVGQLVLERRPDLFLLESDSQKPYDLDIKGLYESYGQRGLEELVYANAALFTS